MKEAAARFPPLAQLYGMAYRTGHASGFEYSQRVILPPPLEFRQHYCPLLAGTRAPLARSHAGSWLRLHPIALTMPQAPIYAAAR